MSEDDLCPQCGDDWVGRHTLSLDEDDERGDTVKRYMHGMGRHCTVFTEDDDD